MQNAMQQTLNATKADTNTRKAIAVANIAINEAESIAAAVAKCHKRRPYTIAWNCRSSCERCGGDDAGKQRAKWSERIRNWWICFGSRNTGTSDSIPVRLSNGESVINANATSQFAPLLSALNQSAGGAPITSQSDNNYLCTPVCSGIKRAAVSSCFCDRI